MDIFFIKNMSYYISFLKNAYKRLGMLKLLIVFFSFWIVFAELGLLIKDLITEDDYQTLFIFNKGLIFEILEVAIFGPLVETFLNQFLVIYLSRKWLNSYSILLSALIFGVLHLDLYMFLYFFIFGFILASLYYFFRYYTNEKAFLITFLFHALFNFYAIMVNHFFS